MQTENTANQSRMINLGMQFFAEGGEPAAPNPSPAPEGGNPSPSAAEGTPAQPGAKEPAPSSAPAPQGTEPKTQEPKTYELKHNKETVKLTEDELLSAASKGLDYDRIRPTYDYIKSLADKSGAGDVGQFIQNVQTNLSQADHAKNVQRYIDRGIDAETAEELAQTYETGSQFKQYQQEQQRQQRERVQAAQEFDAIRQRYPEVFKNGKPELPEGALKILQTAGAENPTPRQILDALNENRIQELTATVNGYKAKDTAGAANAAGAAASTGSASGGEAAEKDYYTSKEWDNLPAKTKDKFIRSGKIYEFMKKWSEKK